MVYTKYESLGHSGFILEEFCKLQFENLLYGPVPYIGNQSEQFENVWQETT